MRSVRERPFCVLGATIFWIFSGIRISHEYNNTTFNLVFEAPLFRLDFCRSQKSRVAKAYCFRYRGPQCIYLCVKPCQTASRWLPRRRGVGRPRKFGTKYLNSLASISKVLMPIMKGVKLLMLFKLWTFGNMKIRLIWAS